MADPRNNGKDQEENIEVRNCEIITAYTRHPSTSVQVLQTMLDNRDTETSLLHTFVIIWENRQLTQYQGASPSEQLIEACRRGNTDLLQEIISSAGSPEKAAILLNETKTVLGNYPYHEAASRGNWKSPPTNPSLSF